MDQEDFGRLQACLTGPGVAQDQPSCEAALLDDDSDVDGADVASFVGCMSGPDNRPYPDGCDAFDFNRDLDVDLTDLRALQCAFHPMP